jgi:hypothetical protein
MANQSSSHSLTPFKYRPTMRHTTTAKAINHVVRETAMIKPRLSSDMFVPGGGGGIQLEAMVVRGGSTVAAQCMIVRDCTEGEDDDDKKETRS